MKNQFIAFILLMIPVLGFSQVPGSDRDKHGCIGSAGYSYSQIKKECIQIFNEENKLNSVGDESYSTVTCVIFSEDSKKAEIFLPNVEKSIILKKKGETWKKSAYQLAQTNEGYELKKDEKVIYKS